MPSDQATWLISVPQGGNPEELFTGVRNSLAQQAKLAPRNTSRLEIPSFKARSVQPTGTLDGLIALSEELPKLDTFFTNTVAKTVDSLRNLVNNDPFKMALHVLVEENSVDYYLLSGWRWNAERYDVQKSLRELVDSLNAEMVSIDNVLKTKINNYNLIKGSLTQQQRKKTGNLSVRSLADIVSKEDVISGSEYLETAFVAVPNTLVKDWNNKYERLTKMVVPRSAHLLSSDEEYSLFSVVIFTRVRDEFIQKCRESKFTVRDFVYSEEESLKQQQELETTESTERELWTELLQVVRTNFSESFQLLVHLKVVRLFVESVLRYGLPAEYLGFAIKPDPKTTKKAFNTLQTTFGYLRPRSKAAQGGSTAGDDFAGEYQTVLDQEFFDFVLYEVPWIVT